MKSAGNGPVLRDARAREGENVRSRNCGLAGVTEGKIQGSERERKGVGSLFSGVSHFSWQYKYGDRVGVRARACRIKGSSVDLKFPSPSLRSLFADSLLVAVLGG